MSIDLKYRSYVAILIFGFTAPFFSPNYTFQLAMLWVMIVFALTWDIMGGQMGYNSLGNIFFSGGYVYIGCGANRTVL